MNITFLDASTVDSGDINFNEIKQFGNLTTYSNSNSNNTAERIKESEIVITNKVILDKETIETAENLKLVVVSATGYNNVDLKSAGDKNVIVCNVVNYSTQIVAQHTLSLILNLCGQTHKYLYEKSLWPKSPIFTRLDHKVNEIYSKKLGIAGVGNIGENVGTIAEAMGMKVQVLHRKESSNERHPEWKRVTSDEFFSTSDIISLHCPLTESNHHLVNEKTLSLMKKGSYLINTSRGGLIDELALATALKNNVIGGAALDVLSVEPPPIDHCLMQESIPNLLITPHNAWTSIESRKRLIKGIVENIDSFIKGTPINVVS